MHVQVARMEDTLPDPGEPTDWITAVTKDVERPRPPAVAGEVVDAEAVLRMSEWTGHELAAALLSLPDLPVAFGLSLDARRGIVQIQDLPHAGLRTVVVEDHRRVIDLIVGVAAPEDE